MEIHTNEKRKFLVDTAYAVTVLGLLYIACQYLLTWFFPFIIGYLIASVVRPLVRRCAAITGLSERRASCLVLITVYILLGLVLIWCGAALLHALVQQVAELPDFYRETLRPALIQLSLFLQQILPTSVTSSWSAETLLETAQSGIFDFSAGMVARIGAVTASIPDLLMTFLFTVLCSLLISSNYYGVSKFLGRQVPVRYRTLAGTVRRGTGEAVWSYIRAYILILFFTFLQLTAGLWLLGVERFVFVSAVIALLDFIPAVGMSLVFLPWSLLCFLRGESPLGIGLLLLFGIVVAVHSILEPKLVGAQLGISPLVSLCAVYFGYQILGVLGMMLVPIAVQLVVGLQKSGVIRLWK